jgi:hypothetical protein
MAPIDRVHWVCSSGEGTRQPDLIAQPRKEQAQREHNDREPNYGRSNIETLVAFTQAV